MSTSAAPAITPQQPVLRWTARAHSIAEVEEELARIWAGQDLTAEVDGTPGRHVGALAGPTETWRLGNLDLSNLVMTIAFLL
jgi:hypothetical protein